MSQEILPILTRIYKIFCEYIKKNKIKFVSMNDKISIPVKDNLIIMEIDSNVVVCDSCFYGVTIIRVDNWINHSECVKVADINNYYIDYIAIKFKENNKDLPIELIVYTFIHELVHVFTLPEKHRIKNVSRNYKKKIK